MNRSFVYKILTVFLFCLLLSPPAFGAAEPSRALLLYSYHPGFPTFLPVTNGLKKVFDANDVKLDVEVMDTKRFYNDTNFENFTRALSHKLDSLPTYDVLIAADDNALNYATQHRKDLFRGIPIVFLGINDVENGTKLAREHRLTGVLESVSMEETVGLMHLLLPDLKNIVVVSDGTPSGQADLHKFENTMTLRGETRYSVLDLSLIQWTDFPALVKQLSPNDAIIVLSLYRDMNGKTLSFDDGFSILNENAPCPIFHCWQHGIGDGMLGGKVVSFEEQGRLAAEQAIKIINGANPPAIPIVQGTDANIVMFDMNILERFGISKSDLPEGSVLINDHPSFLEKHRSVLIEAGLMIFLLVMIITCLVRVNRVKAAAEKEALENVSRYRKYLDGAPDGVIVFDELGTILQVNPAMEQISGFARKELVGTNALTLLPDEDRSKGEQGLKSLAEDAEHSEEYRVVRKDGTRARISFHGVVLDDGSTLGFCRDLTAEDDIRAALEQSESLFRGLLEQAGDAVFACDATGQLVFVNEAACKSLGYTRSELLALKAWDVDPSAADSKVRGKQWNEEHVIVESTHTRKNGSVFPVELRLGRIKAKSGDTILGIARDISERKKNEQAVDYEQRANIAHSAVIHALSAHNSSFQIVSDAILSEAMSLTESAYAYIGVIEPPENDLHLYSFTAMSGQCEGNAGVPVLKREDDRFPSLWGDSLNTGKADFTNMATRHPLSKGVPEGHAPIDRFLAVPCWYEDELVGQIALANSTRDYTDEDLKVVETIGELLAIAIYRERVESELLRSRSLKE